MKKNIKRIFLCLALMIGFIGVNAPIIAEESSNINIIKDHLGRDIDLPLTYENKEREFRGAWVSTVYNLDFPSKAGLTQEAYKKEYLGLLDNLEAYNLNTVIFQIRPKGDAFYKSDINPWSVYLTGLEGKDPGWDPLEWMIGETQKRGMEFHAWINPYRITTSAEASKSKGEILSSLSEGNWARKNPDQVFLHKGRLYLDPADDKVIEHINETVMEIVYKYRVDGIHLDDYFYPNVRGEEVKKFYSPKEELQFKNQEEFKNLGDFRRDRVDRLVYKLSNSIRTYNENHKTSVQLGISPFGIWNHKSNNPEGSNTPWDSLSSYENHFANTKKWVEEEWIDYIAPQIYWTFKEKAAPYGELVDWWANLVGETKVDLYIGHALYKLGESNMKGWQDPMEISNQLAYNRLYDVVKGSIFFRAGNLIPGGNPVRDEFLNKLKYQHYNTKAKLPEKRFYINEDIKEPYGLSVKEELNSNIVSWKDHKENLSDHYIIYRQDLSTREMDILDIVPRKDGKNYLVYSDGNVMANKKYRYFLSAVTKSGYESDIVSK